MVYDYSNPNWVLFVRRIHSILQRSFRSECFFGAGRYTDLKITRTLIIRDDSVNFVFLKNDEDRRNFEKIKKYYNKKLVEAHFKRFKKLLANNRFKSIKNPLKKAIEMHRLLGAFLVYSHYFDRILVEEKKKIYSLTISQKRRLNKLIKESSYFRNLAVEMDAYFQSAYKYLQKKYPKHKEIDNYLVQELVDNRKLSDKEIEARHELCVFLFLRRKYKALTRSKAEVFLRKEGFVRENIKQEREIKGLAVYRHKNKIKGRILIAKELSDFKKIKNLSEVIAVSPMTVPQFSPYLKKVKAIITDEGGVICHAAITAREFKLPCIVGTKIATKVFKDGDLVEVDAERGIVRYSKEVVK